jgi:hypothetical protein
MRHARRDLGYRAGEARRDRPVMVAAENALDIRITGDDLAEAIGAFEQANSVHVDDAAVEGRVVHEDDDRLAVRTGERLFQEAEAFVAERAGALAGSRVSRPISLTSPRSALNWTKPSSSTACGPSVRPAVKVSRRS